MHQKLQRFAGIACLAMALTGWAGAQELQEQALPAPHQNGGKPLMDVLKLRQTSRSFSPKPLPPQVLSDLLWAANGINRPDGKRTAPSTRNWQEIAIYAVLPDGAWLYDARGNRLTPVAKGDLRKLTGMQAFAATAPLNLVFVADTAKMKGASPEDQSMYAAADAAFISQNIYLFCASEGLGTVVRGSVDRAPLAKALNLPDTQKIIFAQTVGYP